MSEHARIGIIGCGAIAEIYHLPALVADPATRNGIALAEPNDRRRSEMADKFNCQIAVNDYRKLLDHVDGVVIATPPTTHFEIAKWFLENKKHVLCEKPLTESSAEARELVELARTNGLHLAVNQTRRFFPSYQKLRELISSGEFGELEEIVYHDGIEFDWPAASPHHFKPDAKGAWSDTGVHLLDTVCYWLGKTPELDESQNDSCGGPEAMATVKLKHQQCKIEIKVSRLGRLSNSFTIRGTKASVTAGAEDFSELNIEYKNGKRSRVKCGTANLKYTDFAKPLLSNFAQCLTGNAKPAVAGEDVVGTVELLEEAYEKATRYPMPWNQYEPPGSHVSPITDRRIDYLAEDHNPDRTRRVLVTGGSGFLGARLIEIMHATGFATPVGTLRNWSRAARSARFPVELVLCDIENQSQVNDLVANGFDAIVHTAYSDTRESIVGGTKNLLDAAAKHKIANFIFISSAEVYGSNVSGVIDEGLETPKTGSLYGDCKIEAEELCRSYHSQGVAATILRPSLIYGPFSSSWTIDIAKKLQSGKWGTFDGSGEGIANLVYVDDLARAILYCLTNESARNQTFNVNGPNPPTWNEYFEAFNEALHCPELQQISSSKSKLRTFIMDRVGGMADAILDRYEDQLMEIYLKGGWASKLMKKIKGELDATPTNTELNGLYSRTATYGDKKLRDATGFEPNFDLKTGLALSTQWLKLHELTQHDIPTAQSSLESKVSSANKPVAV